MWNDDAIYFGTRSGSAAYPNGGSPVGVFRYEPDTDILTFDAEISTGTTASTGNELGVGAIAARLNRDYLVGWQDNTSYGVDSKTTTDYKFQPYATRFDTIFYRLGSSRDPVTLEEWEIILEKNLASSEAVKVSYRTDKTSDSWTEIIDATFATYGAVSSMQGEFTIPDIKTIQFRIELTTGSSSYATPELVEVRIQ
jgi:hypothetical protein